MSAPTVSKRGYLAVAFVLVAAMVLTALLTGGNERRDPKASLTVQKERGVLKKVILKKDDLLTVRVQVVTGEPVNVKVCYPIGTNEEKLEIKDAGFQQGVQVREYELADQPWPFDDPAYIAITADGTSDVTIEAVVNKKPK